MERRSFLKNIAALGAGMELAPVVLSAVSETEHDPEAINGASVICEFKNGSETWKVYEDLRTRDGAFIFVSARGRQRVLKKSAEATFPEANPAYLGLKLSDIGTAGPDLLADKLLAHGDPNPDEVKSAAPPLGSTPPENPNARLTWNNIVGTKECADTMPVFPTGNTRTYHPNQYFSEINTERAFKRYEGLVGGWMPAVRKVMPLAANAHLELIIFGDVEAKDRFIVQTWHRTAKVEDGKITKVVYGYSYPAFPPIREDPKPEEFFRALLVFAEYWEKNLGDVAACALPDQPLVDMARYAFAKELMVRPGGVYPKYGAVDRDYYGSEYDGFQDTFTSAVYVNLEWGRFEQARHIIDNYFTDFVADNGAINMRGPETAQFGLTLSLLARYFNYTGDATLLLKHQGKIEATAEMLGAMHEESLKLPKSDPGYGLIHGWSESDACLAPKPDTWWRAYFGNSAFVARGLTDLARVWPQIKSDNRSGSAAGWNKRAQILKERVAESIRENTRGDMHPPYIGPLPGAKLTFRESMEQERPSPQQWPHRAYAELLQADMLPDDLANTVINCMRAYGATTLGVVANVGRASPRGRAILGFISYGYAQMLLRLDRVEEYLLFLYSHRYHDHTRGSWTAGEVAGIGGGTAIFCIPAQHTIPMLVRWMLVLEDSDEDRLYFGKGLPREWMASGEDVRIDEAPTRWGRVKYSTKANLAAKSAIAQVEFSQTTMPKELQVKFRLPVANTIQSATVNGRPARIGGRHQDCVIVQTGGERRYLVGVQIA